MSDNLKPLLKAVETAFKMLHKKGTYKPEDLEKVPEYKKIIRSTAKILNDTLKDNQLSNELIGRLENDIFLFSSLKTHAQLFEASRLLLTKDKTIKSFSQFSNDISKIKKNYNENYLEAEYDFAVGAVQMAERWESFEDGDKYYLQYRTANDDRVRDSHRVLHDITLPKSDPFWDSYFAPNGWRCRCTVVQVLSYLNDKSDPKKAIELGEKATTKLGKKGENKLAIFRFNPAKQKVIFPPKHPYNKVVGAKAVKATVKKQISEKTKTIRNEDDLTDYFKSFAKKNPDYFARSFKYVTTTRRRGVNGYTGMKGDIYLKKTIMNKVISGINNINKGRKTTYLQEQAISTLHHEIMHNANKIGYVDLTKIDTRYMELANEFVSRKRLPEFMKSMGGKLENTELMNDRGNTGYNTMVRNYDQLIKFSKANKSKVLADVEKHLLNETYSFQKIGLVDAIVNNSKLTKKYVTEFVRLALVHEEYGYSELLKLDKKLISKNK